MELAVIKVCIGWHNAEDTIGGLDEAATTTLDKGLHGTKLKLVFQIGRVTPLFRGNTQWDT